MTRALYQTRRDRQSSPKTLPEAQALGLPDWALVKIFSEFVPLEEILEARFDLVRNTHMHFEILKFAIVHQEMTPEMRSKFWLQFCANTDRLVLAELGIQKKVSSVDYSRVYLSFLRAPRSEEAEAEIERDVVRTMPNHLLFRSDSPIGEINRGKLRSVLLAVSSAEPSVGYCQGMNFVAATLLIHLQMDEANAFFMFLSILRDYHFQYLYSPAVPLLPLRMSHFSRVIRAHVPSVWHHLNAKTFSVEIFANQWIMTLFAYYLSPEVLEKVWSLFFLLGWEYIFQIGATILFLLEKKITEMDVEEISAFMQSARKDRNDRHPFGDPTTLQAELLMSISKFPISNADLETYTQQFLTEKLLTVIRDVKPPPAKNKSKKKIAGNASPIQSSSFRASEHAFTEVPTRIAGLSMLYADVSEACSENDSSVSSRQSAKRTPELAFLKIDLSCFTTPNRPHEFLQVKNRWVEIPIQSIREIGGSVDFIAESFAKDVGRISADLDQVQKQLQIVGKQFNHLLNQISRADENLKKVAKKKYILAIALRDSVGNVPLSPLVSPTGSFDGLDSPVSAKVKVPKTLGDLLALVTETESDFAEKKTVRDKLQEEVTSTEAKMRSLNQKKEDTIVELSRKVAESENVQNEIIYRCIQSAIDSFSIN